MHYAWSGCQSPIPSHMPDALTKQRTASCSTGCDLATDWPPECAASICTVATSLLPVTAPGCQPRLSYISKPAAQHIHHAQVADRCSTRVVNPAAALAGYSLSASSSAYNNSPCGQGASSHAEAVSSHGKWWVVWLLQLIHDSSTRRSCMCRCYRILCLSMTESLWLAEATSFHHPAFQVASLAQQALSASNVC